jgi:hypothetical protein
MEVAEVMTVRRGHCSGGHHSGNEGVDENHCDKEVTKVVSERGVKEWMESRVNLKATVVDNWDSKLHKE